MSTLYRPVLIESAEQAEALPVGTVAAQAEEGRWPALVCIRVEWGWNCTGVPDEAGEPFLVGHDLMVGDTALVPIEAEEEFSAERSRSKWSFDGIYRNTGDVRADDWDGPMQTRYVTPWEAS